MARSPRSDAEVKIIRGRILDAAARVFSRHGVSGVTMDQIAKESGYSSASLYNYFSSRSAVVLALVDRSVQQLLSVVETSLPASLTPEQRLESILLRFLQVSIDHQWLVSTLMNQVLAEESAGEVGARYQAVHGRLMSALREEVAKLTWIPKEQVPRLTFHFAGMIRTESFAWQRVGVPEDLTALTSLLMTYWLGGARAVAETA